MGTFVKKSREERIDEILNAATKVFLKKGYSNTTMEDIIAATTLSKGGFYYYFKSTRDIFFAIIKQKTEKQINFFHKIDTAGKNKLDIIDEISAKLAHQVMEEFDERTLYLMTVSEIINDPEFRNISVMMEENFLDKIKISLLEKIPDMDPVILEGKLKFLSSIFHAMIFYCHIFKEEELYNKNRDTLHMIFAQILKDI